MPKPTLLGAAGMALALLTLPASAAVQGQNEDVVQLPSGRVHGSTRDGVRTFFGLPYAAPPVGERRWRPPAAPVAWQGIRSARHFGPACPQSRETETQLAVREAFSEDCLYLNVWAPAALAPGASAPVMVWLHGGGFIAGAGSDAVFDGRGLARRGVILVSLNYRLGRLGFFAHPALGQATANFALLDQLAALRWVQDHIAAFGGDPHNVTLFGESAGGIAALALLASPAAEGLFNRLIVQSGAILRPMRRLRQSASGNEDGGEDRDELPSAEALGLAFAAAQGLSGSDSGVAQALRNLPLDAVAPAHPSYEAVMEIAVTTAPSLDDTVLPEHPLAYLRALPPAKRPPILLGSNTLEAQVWQFALERPSLLPLLEVPSRGVAGAAVSALLALGYRDENPDEKTDETPGQKPGENAGAAAPRDLLASDLFLGAGTLHLAALWAHDGADTNANKSTNAATANAYLYRFNAVPEALRGYAAGAPHGMELFYVFESLAQFPGLGDEVPARDAALASTVADYWAGFAHNGRSGGPGLPDWPAFDASQPRLMAFENDGAALAPVPRIGVLRWLWRLMAWTGVAGPS
ncbi:carboxylesterase/lipase family protein [Parahaliea mediterranea]|uniref:carboxylesterase/lipase family protein n=1 Tax=Parahaliea mediterranea TaxID=651086 RepID=UPI000E2E55F3|nr:carboxylesterase family protein [Parahaliea mediterranea]